MCIDRNHESQLDMLNKIVCTGFHKHLGGQMDNSLTAICGFIFRAQNSKYKIIKIVSYLVKQGLIIRYSGFSGVFSLSNYYYGAVVVEDPDSLNLEKKIQWRVFHVSVVSFKQIQNTTTLSSSCYCQQSEQPQRVFTPMGEASSLVHAIQINKQHDLSIKESTAIPCAKKHYRDQQNHELEKHNQHNGYSKQQPIQKMGILLGELLQQKDKTNIYPSLANVFDTECMCTSNHCVLRKIKCLPKVQIERDTLRLKLEEATGVKVIDKINETDDAQDTSLLKTYLTNVQEEEAELQQLCSISLGEIDSSSPENLCLNPDKHTLALDESSAGKSKWGIISNNGTCKSHE
eukprot:Gb_27716 [translate_table: standard]